MYFSTEKAMRNHKKHSDEHEYCHKCDEDFDAYEDYAQHKITRPEEHGKACRVCGDEFKSDSGLRRHIEMVCTPTHCHTLPLTNFRATRLTKSLPVSDARSHSTAPVSSLSTSSSDTAMSSPPLSSTAI